MTNTWAKPAYSTEFIYSQARFTTTITYMSPASTESWTYSSVGSTRIVEQVYPDSDFYPYGRDPCVGNTANTAWVIPVG